MSYTDIIGNLMAALGKIAEIDKPLEATSHANWRDRAKLIARNAIDQAKKDLRRQSQQDKDIPNDW